jgi:Glycosyl hydrolase family 63 C-terminal domain
MLSPEFDITPSAWKTGRYLEWYVDDPLVVQNAFLKKIPETQPIPSFDQSKGLLPQPHLPSRPDSIVAYWKAWELAWKNLHSPAPGSGFVSNYIDTAFNDCLFMWDSAFIVQFGRYGDRAFRFQGTLDNLYAKQHPDGYICREIRVTDGTDQWHRTGPFATGPNVLAWAEWIHFENFGDLGRLREVYAPLAAYHRWTRKNRTWPDGSYWTTGLGCGMDNMGRVPAGCDPAKEHAWMAWTDATFQAILSARILARMADILGIKDEIEAAEEAEALSSWANRNLWDEKEGFYFDRNREGELLCVKSVAGYWALLAGLVPNDRIPRFVNHLSDPKSFNRPHRVPTLASDAPQYVPDGGDYWCGAVWAPTNYMVLRGLSDIHQDDLAYEIAANHHCNVIEVFKQTGTFWENYSPESAAPGSPAKDDFVGWTGLPPIAVFLEYILGLRPIDPLTGKLLWDIRLLEEHGVDQYPLGPKANLSLHCKAREKETDEPQVTIKSDTPVEVQIRWKNGAKTIKV